MKDSLQQKLDRVVDRYQELAALLSDPDIIGDTNRYRDLSREYAELEPVVQSFERWRRASENCATARAMLEDSDAEMRAMGQEELAGAQQQLEQLEAQLQTLMLPRDPRDRCNVFLDIRAGTGGDEAAIFAGDLFRMYSRFADREGWKVEVVSASEGEHGGYREIISRVSGDQVYSRLKFESGAHRVQRVPVTESQGRIHTSACTVAVMPEADEVAAVEIRTEDLRVDTYRSSGAGGQHVNTTDSAVRITHKNKAKAMSLLRARLLDKMQRDQASEQAATRKSLVGSGDRSERIRTYNFPQGRLTDHRINLTLYKLDDIMEGDLDDVLDALQAEHQAEQLMRLSEAS